jgi:hypothetical protein
MITSPNTSYSKSSLTTVTLVDFYLVEQQNKQAIARLQFKEPLPPPQVAVPVNSASTQTSFVQIPSCGGGCGGSMVTSSNKGMFKKLKNKISLRLFFIFYIYLQDGLKNQLNN